MVILIILSEMKNKIDLVLRELQTNNITKHVICPSVKSILSMISDSKAQTIEIIDERSAGYVATGMCDEISAPVVIWCANNDSIRNLAPSLTEAYYRKMPLLVIALNVSKCVNHCVYPYDIIRYDVSQNMADVPTFESWVAKAINFMSADIKGPVFLPINLHEETSVFACDVTDCKVQIDITNIIEQLPSDACIHVGKDFRYDNVYLGEIVSRVDHSNCDGNVSMLIGSSVVDKEQVHIGIFGFDEVAYDLNMLGNRHINDNVIIICVNPPKEVSSIPNFVRNMFWYYKTLRIDEIGIKEELFAKVGKPQFIEIVL